MKKLKVFEMFAGYGGASFGLKMAGIDHEVVGFSEIDKFAEQCWKQNHGQDVKNWGDCTKINPEELPDFDLLTGGFPCQAFSLAGKGDGINDPRGLLFNEIVKKKKKKKPKFMLLENVKGLLSKKHKEFFEYTLNELQRLGYKIDVRVYNSKNYGTPQNRERVYYVCQLNGLHYNPPLHKNFVRAVNFLENDVPAKYIVSEKAKQGIFKSGYNDRKPFDPHKVSPTLKVGEDVKCFICELRYDEGIRTFKDGVIGTLSTLQSGGNKCVINNVNMRRITPKEAFRFMGFFNDEINIDGLSDTQCYKLAGNGWDVNLVKQIFQSWFN